MHNFLLFLLFLLFNFKAQPMAYSCNLIYNIDAEEANCTTSCNYPSGSTAFSPWEIGGFDLDAKCGDQAGWFAVTGTCFFDLVGNSFSEGTLDLTFPATIGHDYTLQLNFGSSDQTSDFKNLYIWIDGNQVQMYPEQYLGDNVWFPESYTFTATATSHWLSLRTDSPLFGDIGAYVDSIRLYECYNQTESWCFQSYANSGDCGTNSNFVDVQEYQCGCQNLSMNADCNIPNWTFSLANQCSPDDGGGVFDTCEAQPSTYSKSYLGECVSTGQTFGITVQTNNFVATEATTTIFTDLVCGNYTEAYLDLNCGECSFLSDVPLYTKISCTTLTFQIYTDDQCLYPVAGPYEPETCTQTEYDPDRFFILTEEAKCEGVYLGHNCSGDLLNTTDEMLCWSENTMLPNGTFPANGWKSFRINCPAKTLQFFSTNDCTGPVQQTHPQTAGCSIPNITVNVSVHFDSICSCGSISTPTPSPSPSPTPTPSPTPIPAPPPADACFREYENTDCTSLSYSQNLTFGICNPITGTATFGAFPNISGVTTYANPNCTVTTNVVGFDVCFQILSPFAHSGIFILGDCTGPLPTITPSPTPSASSVSPSSPSVSSNTPSSTSVGSSTSQTTNSISSSQSSVSPSSTPLSSSSGMVFYILLFTHNIHQSEGLNHHASRFVVLPTCRLGQSTN